MSNKPWIFLLDWWLRLFLPLVAASSVSWKNHFAQILRADPLPIYHILCTIHGFQLSGLQRNNKFFEILTHMDNEQHVCKCSLTCQDILNSLVLCTICGFQLSGLQRINKFFEILTHMDNEQHVCKCSLTCQDILNYLVTFSLIDSIFPFKSRQHR